MGTRKGQYISNKRPSRFVILSASFGSLAGQRSFAALRMTLLHRLRLTRKTSYLKCIAREACPFAGAFLFLQLSPVPVVGHLGADGSVLTGNPNAAPPR